MKLAKSSLILLGIQLALVSSIAGKYLYQRARCPRVWTRAAAYDPEMVMRGRYLSLRLTVDGCGSTLQSPSHEVFPRNGNGTVNPNDFSINQQSPGQFLAKLKVEENRLVATPIPDAASNNDGVWVLAQPGSTCAAIRLYHPVDFYVAEHAEDPTRLKPGEELWIEVTIPPKGPPRPIQLALKQNGAWRPLAFQ